MPIHHRLTGTPAALTILFFILAMPDAHAEYPGDAIMRILIGDIEGKAHRIIDHARETGNSFATAFAENALSVIAAWKTANKELINDFFEKLDKSNRDFFNNLDATLDKIENERETTFADAQRLTLEWATIVKNLPMTSKDAELYYYTPRVFVPVGDSIIPIRLTGPRLANAKPSLTDEHQENIPLLPTSEFELIANIDRTSLKFANTESSFLKLRLKFEKSAGWSSDEYVTRELPIWLLPKIVAHYSITTKINTEQSESGTFTLNVGGRGRDAPYNVAISIPPDLKEKKWKIDTEGLLQNNNWISDLGGDHGHCSGLRRETLSSDGFVFFMDLGHRTVGWSKKDAWQNCRLTVPIKKSTSQVAAGPTIEGDVNWADDKPIDLPPNMASYTVNLKMFNGRSYVIKDIDHLPYGALSIIKNDGNIVFRPNPPKDF